MITVAQAFHWFDMERFYKEAKRLLKPGGLLAIWGYSLLKVNPSIDAIVNYIHDIELKDHWNERRKLVDSGLSDVIIPFNEISCPQFEMEISWDFTQFIGYINTWSAITKFKADKGYNLLLNYENELAEAWGQTKLNKIRFPLFTRMGKF